MIKLTLHVTSSAISVAMQGYGGPPFFRGDPLILGQVDPLGPPVLGSVDPGSASPGGSTGAPTPAETVGQVGHLPWWSIQENDKVVN